MVDTIQYATGKKKYAIARAWIEPGQGNIQINSRTLEDYFPQDYHTKSRFKLLLIVTKTEGQFNVKATLSRWRSLWASRSPSARHRTSLGFAFNPSLRDPTQKTRLADPRLSSKRNVKSMGKKEQGRSSNTPNVNLLAPRITFISDMRGEALLEPPLFFLSG